MDTDEPPEILLNLPTLPNELAAPLVEVAAGANRAG